MTRFATPKRPSDRAFPPLAAVLSLALLAGSVAAPAARAVAAPQAAAPLSAVTITPPNPDNPLALGPDSKEQPGVPKGEVLHFTFDHSQIFPGTSRDYWVYVPAQYSPEKPACLYVNQDGRQWNATTVFDNLIAKGQMPVTIGVFVTPGVVHAKDKNAALDRYNRSLEYDGLGPNYARFLIDELLPEVETKKTSDGRAIHFSHDGKDRAIGGSSSGAIAAFTAAWERPDSFTRVFSVVGTYVGLRGGEVYPTLIRKTEPKPLRVFLEDGSNDLNIYGGDWWMANNTMERALVFAGYEVNHVWGTHGHDGREGAAIFPDVMRWLWQGWPAPVGSVAPSRNQMLGEVLIPGEGWQLAPQEKRDMPGTRDTSAVMVRAEADWTQIVLHNALSFHFHDRRIDGGTSWRHRHKVIENDQTAIGGITVSPDQTQLYVSDAASHWVWSYQIQPDGSLAYGQKYFWLHSPDDSDDAGAGGMCVDSDGRLYVATRIGIQICDQAGRVNVILPLPGNVRAAEVTLEGPNNDVLTVITDKGVTFTRHLKAHGVNSFQAPIKPAAPHL